MWWAGEFEEDGGGPVVEDRLFEPRLAVETRRDPVAGFGHVASDPGVAGFVGPNKAYDVEVAEVADVEGEGDKGGPGDALGEGRVNPWLSFYGQRFLSVLRSVP